MMTLVKFQMYTFLTNQNMGNSKFAFHIRNFSTTELPRRSFCFSFLFSLFDLSGLEQSKYKQIKVKLNIKAPKHDQLGFMELIMKIDEQ